MYLTDGRVKLHDKPNSSCSWTPENVDTWLRDTGNSPSAQLFHLMYLAAFAPLDDDAKPLAAKSALDVVRNQPSSAAAYFYAAVTNQKIATYTSLAFNEADRSAYDRRQTELYSQALNLDPKIEEAYAQRADEHLREKDYSLAITDYDHALQISPLNSALWNDRGIAKEETYDKNGAIDDFSKAIELKIAQSDFTAVEYSLDNRAALYVKLGDYNKALADYNSLIGHRLHDVMFSINLDFFRQLYPEYAQVDNTKLEDKLRRMYYPNFSVQTFHDVITKPAGAHPSLTGFLPEAYLLRADVLLALKAFTAAQSDLKKATLSDQRHANDRWRTPPGLQNVRIDLQTLDVANPENLKIWMQAGTEDSNTPDDSPHPTPDQLPDPDCADAGRLCKCRSNPRQPRGTAARLLLPQTVKRTPTRPSPTWSEGEGAIFRSCDRRSQQLLSVIPNTVHLRVRRVHLHRVGVERPQQIYRQSVHLLPIQPAIVVLSVQNHRHPRMQRRHQLVRLCCHNRKGLEPVTILVLPSVPDSRKSKQMSVHQFKGVGLFRWLPFFWPFIKGIRWNQATSFLHRLSPGSRRFYRFRTGVDRRQSFDFLQIFRKERHQSPSSQHHLSLPGLSALPNNRLKGGRSYVVVLSRHRQFQRLRFCMKPLCDFLLVAFPNVTSTHL